MINVPAVPEDTGGMVDAPGDAPTGSPGSESIPDHLSERLGAPDSRPGRMRTAGLPQMGGTGEGGAVEENGPEVE